MQLQMPVEVGARYTSPSQRARVVTEAWGARNLYCPNCVSPELFPAAPNTEAIDFTCPDCESPFQLKSQSRPFSARIVDAGYDAMCRAIVSGRTPNLLTLHYDAVRWEVRDLLLIPRFVFSLSCLEKRKPLSPGAERRHWVGCNILLASIPPDARIPVVSGGAVTAPTWVREQYARLRPLERLGHEARGWTLDVLKVVRGLVESRRGTPWRAPTSFRLAEVYAYAAELQRLHPQNRNVLPKIRQQLQRLRDLGFLEFLGGGRYRLT